MKRFHILSVGIVLATALCGPAKATNLLPNEPLVTTIEDPQSFSLPRLYKDTPYDVKKRNLTLVHRIADEYGYSEVMQAMLLQETNGGTHPTLIGSPNAPANKRSYGIMQVQVQTAREMFKRVPNLLSDYFPEKELSQVSDREIKRLLLKNHEANVTIAVLLFDLYLVMSNGNVDRAIAAYNVGIGGVKKLRSPSKFKYVVEVKQKLNAVVKPFNQAYGLGTAEQLPRSVVYVQ